jgi:hypothetical protein
MRRLYFCLAALIAIGCFKADVDTVPHEMIEKLRANTTPEAVRGWLEVTAAARLKETNRIDLPSSAWPPWISVFHTTNDFMMVGVTRTNGDVAVSVVWLARPYHGFDLHASTNAQPRDAKLVRSEMWVPGMYAWFSRGD